MTRVIASPWVPNEDAIYLMADMDHPELHWFTDDFDEADGTVVVCHPAKEQIVRDILSRIGENWDVGTILTALRKRDSDGEKRAKL